MGCMGRTRKLLVAKINEVPVGRTKHFRFGYAEGIAYNDRGVIKAYVNRCTHMGGQVDLVADRPRPVLRCRWHAAEFDPATGQAICGQAPQGSVLTPIQLVEENGQVLAVLELPDDPFGF